MSTATNEAKACFEDNLRRFGDAQTQLERFNLYTGLIKLAEAIASLQRAVREIEDDVAKIKRSTG